MELVNEYKQWCKENQLRVNDGVNLVKFIKMKRGAR